MASRHAKSRLPSWLAWLGIGDLVLVAIVGVLSFYYEDFKEDFPRLIIWQLTTYQWIINDSNLHKSSVHWVTPVEIDDRTFYGYLGNQTRDDFTDREFLARLVRKATESCAKVIALDINFDTSSIDNKTPLTTGNDSLLQAIREAYGNGVPVVLVFGFTKGKQVK